MLDHSIYMYTGVSMIINSISGGIVNGSVSNIVYTNTGVIIISLQNEMMYEDIL